MFQASDLDTQKMQYEHVYEKFYRTPRMGALELTCGGGPFGFDISVAVRVDYLISKYNCDAIIETGCHFGDTTDYLSSLYSNIPIWTCDVSAKYVRFVKHRLKARKNLNVILQSSPVFLNDISQLYSFPFYYLDAHWYEYWPLFDEISNIKTGVVCIDDFDVGNSRFGFDSYNGIKCGIELIPEHIRNRCYKDNPMADIGFPCLQIGRRSGKCYYVMGSDTDHFSNCKLFEPISKNGRLS
jgi:hypothetical protein